LISKFPLTTISRPVLHNVMYFLTSILDIFIAYFGYNISSDRLSARSQKLNCYLK